MINVSTQLLVTAPNSSPNGLAYVSNPASGGGQPCVHLGVFFWHCPNYNKRAGDLA